MRFRMNICLSLQPRVSNSNIEFKFWRECVLCVTCLSQTPSNVTIDILAHVAVELESELQIFLWLWTLSSVLKSNPVRNRLYFKTTYKKLTLFIKATFKEPLEELLPQPVGYFSCCLVFVFEFRFLWYSVCICLGMLFGICVWIYISLIFCVYLSKTAVWYLCLN